ncbi:uroporphyrinogen-III synthase [Thiomicrorhabdus xiamenensis]|uniref:Uroporphyrinogen-III synthase n=2 Tax=Thiomicrorhabdus xiamenensis TaxID=2739063 RepID=A0A7D4SYU5_9GAMM|nr:uroporphyrinogen-III synthase [Thiomicrorhabdus xiamenensis]
MMLRLADLTLLNTRPSHQATELADLLQRHSVAVIPCPTMAIEWLQDFSVSAELADYDLVIFTSVNAIQGWHQAISKSLSAQATAPTKVLAIGRATAEAGRKLGLPIQTLSEERFDSETLLAHPSMQQLQGQKVLLVKGEGGRDLLPTTLAARQAQIFSLPVYRRTALPFCEQQWLRFKESDHPVLLISSYESFRNLLQEAAVVSPQYLAFDSSAWDFLELAVVFSQRIADNLRQNGWNRPIEVLQTQSNRGVLDALQSYIEKSAL